MFTKRALFFTSLYLLLMGSPVLVPALALADTSTTTIDLTTPATSNIATSTATTTPALDPYSTSDVETAVRSYFADIPVMAAIAKCESSFTQYNTNGKVLNGGSGGMIGVFQINKSVHAKFALSLGDDITTLVGNMAYARYLYTNEGTDPWISSEGCWGPVVSAGLLPAVASSTLGIIKSALTPSVAKAAGLSTTVADVPANATIASSATTGKLSSNLNSNLKLGSTGSQVAILQQLLNSAGYKIAKTGPGSPGQETTTFGPATKLALERFQCANNIACKGSESTTGYGFVGAKTRAALVINS